MTKRTVDPSSERPLLTIASYGRRPSGLAGPFSSVELAHAGRTARGVPEVVVKVSGGARTLQGVTAHLDYIGREGQGEIETDDGARLHEKTVANDLLNDWDLDLEARSFHAQRHVAKDRKPPKLVHNLVLSMPTGTPADKLHKAVRLFAAERFGARHRYAMALHTDQGHPHVHLVVKAVSEDGERLNIRKATLREWRADFARHLRELGVEANATERAVRGVVKPRKIDGVHRAARRGASTHLRQRVEEVAGELARGGLRPEPGKHALVETRTAIVRGWNGLADALDAQGQSHEAAAIRRLVARMPPAQTEKEWIADRLARSIQRNRESPEQELSR